MILLPIPVPPQLEQAVGYPGGADARWLSLTWTCCGDTAVYDDGRCGGTGHAWGYLAFARHPAVAPALEPYDLGTSEADGRQRLVIDRHARRAYAADAEEARRVVREQWPAEEPVRPSAEEMEAVTELLRRALASLPLPSAAELMGSMRRHAQLVAAMVAWLSAWPGDPPGAGQPG